MTTTTTRSHSLAWLLALFVWLGHASAQTSTVSAPAAGAGKRPKVCVVLSGGGARGFAHVGALAALENLRIPIDCIVGTSMGAVVGGLYASGLTADDISQRFAAMDWTRLADDRVDRTELRLQQKAVDFDYPFALELGLRDGALKLPAGVVAGSRFELTLREWLQPAAAIQDFDRLPIPYRSVSTDLESGQEVVLKSGRLFEAIRASMSVPGLFSPVVMDGRLMADGGLVKNLPVDVARGLGADVIIAVNIGTTLSKRNQLDSLLGVYQQMINILTEQNVVNQIGQLRDGDVLVTPDLQDFSFLDFAGAMRLVPLGQAAVMQLAPRLASLSVPPVDYAAWRLAAVLPKPPAAPVVRNIEFSPLERVNPAAYTGMFASRVGEPYDPAKVRSDLRALDSRGDFEHVDARLDPDSGSLVFHAREKSWGPNFFRVGLDLSTEFRGAGRFGLSLGHTRTWLNAAGAYWRNDVRIGYAQSVKTEFVQPFSATSRFYLAPTFSYERRPVDVYVGDERALGVDLATQAFGVRAGASLGSWGDIRIGAGQQRASASIASGGPLLDIVFNNTLPREFKERVTGVLAEVVADQLSHAYFPKSGYRLDLSGFLAAKPETSNGSRYSFWSFDGIHAVTLGAHTLNTRVKAGSVKSASGTVQQRFTLGGFQELSGLNTGQLAGDHLAFARITYYWPFGAADVFGRRSYLGSSVEAGNVWEVKPQSLRWSNLRKGGSVFVGVETPFGPTYLALGRASGGNTAVYLFLGRP